MKLRKMLGGMLAVAMLLLSACGDDEKAAPKSQFDFEGDAVTLKDANLYLAYEDNNDGHGHMYREYFITDGTYDGGDAWDVTDYIDATYVIAIQVGVPMENELAKGSYPLYESFSEAAATSNISWLSFDSSEAYYFTPEGAEGEESLQLSGGFDDGDRMTITYNGPLEFSDDDTADDIEGKLYFRGEVQDVRGLVPARMPAPVVQGGVK